MAAPLGDCRWECLPDDQRSALGTFLESGKTTDQNALLEAMTSQLPLHGGRLRQAASTPALLDACLHTLYVNIPLSKRKLRRVAPSAEKTDAAGSELLSTAAGSGTSATFSVAKGTGYGGSAKEDTYCIQGTPKTVAVVWKFLAAAANASVLTQTNVRKRIAHVFKACLKHFLSTIWCYTDICGNGMVYDVITALAKQGAVDLLPWPAVFATRDHANLVSMEVDDDEEEEEEEGVAVGGTKSTRDIDTDVSVLKVKASVIAAADAVEDVSAQDGVEIIFDEEDIGDGMAEASTTDATDCHCEKLVPAACRGLPHEAVTADITPMLTLGTAYNAKRLYKEFRLMQNDPTYLPEGVFVVYDKTLPCRACAVIVGPQDTPYDSGCFVFSFTCAEYPKKPPAVKLLTTGGGTCRFNPNLYACGKVCLSLLGTWGGPTWNATHSNLRQIFLSIQSLIMVELPYFNEPGRGTSVAKTEARTCSNGGLEPIREGTIAWAWTDVMRCLPPGFHEVITRHFQNAGPRMAEVAVQWLTDVDATPGHVTRMRVLCSQWLDVAIKGGYVSMSMPQCVQLAKLCGPGTPE